MVGDGHLGGEVLNFGQPQTAQEGARLERLHHLDIIRFGQGRAHARDMATAGKFHPPGPNRLVGRQLILLGVRQNNPLPFGGQHGQQFGGDGRVDGPATRILHQHLRPLGKVNKVVTPLVGEGSLLHQLVKPLLVVAHVTRVIEAADAHGDGGDGVDGVDGLEDTAV